MENLAISTLLYWHPAWLDSTRLDSAWPAIADAATYGLAFLGAIMTVKPPAKGQSLLKAVYLLGIALLVGMGLFANKKQRTIEQTNQYKLRQDETDARIQFFKRFDDVQNSNTKILNLVAHPPKGFTQDQIKAVVQAYIDRKVQNTKVESNHDLRVIAPGIVKDLHNWADRWTMEDSGIQANSYHFRDLGKGNGDYSEEMRALNNKNTILILPLMQNANFLREELLKGFSLTAEDKAIAVIFDKVLAGEPIG